MTRIIIYLLCIAGFITSTQKTMGQDMQFTQYYSAPLYLNPALTGFNVCSRLSSNVRNQWPSIAGGFVSQIVAFDHYIPKFGMGTGIMFTNDYAGTGHLRMTTFSALAAYELTLSRELTVRFGLQGGGMLRSVNFYSLTFGDQLARGGASTTIENPTQSIFAMDFSTGGIAFYKKYFMGVAFHHITLPNESLMGDEAIRPVKFSLHGGGKFKIGDDTGDERTQMYLTPTFNYRSQLKYDQLDIGAYYSRHIFNIGLWYRGIPGFKSYKAGYPNNDALCFIFGVSIDRFSMGYSYDYTISWLRGNTGGAHELSLSYQFCKLKPRKKKFNVVICPKF